MRGWHCLALSLAGLALVALVPPGVEAGGCPPRSRAVYQSYSAPAAYVAPAKVTYQQHYSAAPIKTYVQLSPDYYSSTADFYRDSLLADAIAGRTAKLIQERDQRRDDIGELKQELQLLRRQMLFPERQRDREREPEPMPPARNGHDRPAPQRQPSGSLPPVPARLEAIVKAACIRCHGATASSAGGGFDLRDLAAVPREVRFIAYAMVNTGEMPRGGKPLSDEDVLTFYSWASGREVGKK